MALETAHTSGRLDQSKLSELVDRRVRRHEAESLRSALVEILDSGFLRAYLEQLHSATPSNLAALDAEAHPNGFSKVNLAMRPGEWMLRLHMWSHPYVQADIHSHRWDFASQLLAGAMNTATYGLASTDHGDFTRFLCRRTTQNDYFFEQMGPCAVHRDDEAGYSPSGPHLQRHHLLHDLKTIRLPVITVLLQGADLSDWSTVVTRPGAEPPRQRRMTSLPPGRVAEILRTALPLV
jgi:hypothetical protein